MVVEVAMHEEVVEVGARLTCEAGQTGGAEALRVRFDEGCPRTSGPYVVWGSAVAHLKGVGWVCEPPNVSRLSCGRSARGRASARPDRVSGRAHKRNCTTTSGARQLQAQVRL